MAYHRSSKLLSNHIPCCKPIISVHHPKPAVLSKKSKHTNRNSLFATIMSLSFLFFNYCITPFSADELPYYVPSDNIEMNCSPLDPLSYFGSIAANERNLNFSTVSRVYALDPSSHEKPKISACIFTKQFTYPFSVSTGPKFVRLYFKPITYTGLDISNAVFSVNIGRYTLLSTSESSYSKLNSGADYVVREFCIDIDGPILNVTFNPSSKISSSYAFINKIEIVSMPSKLYIQDHVPLPLLGHPSHFSLEDYTALETMYRLNIGGDLIPQPEDSGMFRVWTEDTDYVMSGEGETSRIESNVEIEASSLAPVYAAPLQVYTSARSILDTSTSNYSARWSFPVDSGFYYLVRLHF